MKRAISKGEAMKNVEEFFCNIQQATPKQILKIKKLASGYNIPLKEKRKLFCKKCYSIYKNPKIRIKKNHKVITCENCNFVSRFKIS